MVILPPEIITQVVRRANAADLLVLCRVSKDWQRIAETRLYENVFIRQLRSAFTLCQALTTNDGIRGTYVRRFCFYVVESRGTSRPTPLPNTVWKEIQRALFTMINLDFLLLHDPVTSNTWLLDSPDIKFQVHEANLGLAWDAHTVAFLENQDRLGTLHTEDSLEDGPLCPLAPSKLQALTTFNGPVLVLAELLACPLTHVQIVLEEDTSPILPTVVSDLGRIKEGLRSLSMVFMPEHLMLETLQLASTSVFTPMLRYLGIIPYPVQNRHEVHRCLVMLRALEMLEVDISTWMPQPHAVYRRMLAAELRTYCPSLQRVGFWLSHHHFVWTCQDEEWMEAHYPDRSPQNETLWRIA